MADYKIIIAGFGGQGVVLAGSLLANAALLSGKHVAGMVSYGAEVRGGTANSSVIISDEEISSPIIDKPDIVIALNQPSFDKFKGTLDKNGFIVANSSLIADFNGVHANLIKVPATDIAKELGNIKMANVVAVGTLLKKVNITPIENALAAMDEVFKHNAALIEMNKKALMKGVEFG